MSKLPFKKQLLASAVLSILVSSAHAEQQSNLLNEVVVTATRTEQDAQDVSSSVSKVTSENIESTMAGDIKQAVKYMPGVRAEGSGRFGISGFNIRGMDGSRVKILVDGVQQPHAYNPGASEQRKYPNAIEIDTLAEIEVNKGPSSSLYGSDALGGVVLMRTKNPDDVLITDGNEDRFGIKTGYSSADENFKTTATWARRHGKLETLLMLTYANGSETKTHGSAADVDGVYRGAANPADKKLGNVLAKAFYQINDDHRVGTTIEYYDYSYDEKTRSLEGYSMGSMLTYNDRYSSDNNKRLRLGFEHEWNINAALADDLMWSVNYQDSNTLNENYDTVSSHIPSLNYGRRMRERKASDQTIQLDLQANKLIDSSNAYHMLTYGLAYKDNKFKTENTDYKYDLGTVAPGHTDIPDATTQKFGGFVHDQMFLLDDQLVLNAGIRYDYFNTDPKTNDGYDKQQPSSRNDAFTGKLGAVYHLNDQYSVFGQISQGFKAPTVQQLYYFYDQGAIFEPNPNLKAERSISYETGLRSQTDAAKYEIVGFFNQYRDFITTQKVGTSEGKDVYSPTNLDQVEIKGLEFSSTALLDRLLYGPTGLYAKFSIAYTEGKDLKTGKELDTISPLTAVLALGYDDVINNWGGITSLTMVGRKTEWQEEDNVDAPGYAVMDVTAYYKPLEDLTLRAGLFNAFDTKYWLYEDLRNKTSSSTHRNNDLYTQPGRNWGVNLEYMF
ncbi:TonB-dependent hemoglobin/transferrin/lactoferrin family receptor [Vibrio parahaemolyticus]|uniref:TonB-dependent hemoglobin/transferrin/lactoferrin family receptor n=1 Tax=Vibrio mediterranei TaxID=689 RepID=UPI0040676A3C